MGVITYLIGKLIYPLLFTGGATVFAFRLGSELPIAARRAGRSIGMGYNYFKVTLRVRSPISIILKRVLCSFSPLSPNKPTRLSRSSGRPRSRPTPSPVSSSIASARKESSSRRSCRSWGSTLSKTTSSLSFQINHIQNRNKSYLRGQRW